MGDTKLRAEKISYDFPDLDRVEYLAAEAFPPEEYFAPKQIIELSERSDMYFWGLYDGDEFVGFMTVRLFEEMCYLCFLAVMPDKRCMGYGGKALALLEEMYSGRRQVLDFEKTDESAPNNAQRIRRRSFYLRNGYRETGNFIRFRGVDFEIFCKDDGFDFSSYQRMLKAFSVDAKYFGN